MCMSAEERPLEFIAAEIYSISNRKIPESMWFKGRLQAAKRIGGVVRKNVSAARLRTDHILIAKDYRNSSIFYLQEFK